MSDDFPKPIYSSRAGDPSIDEAVDRFVIGLSERVDQLQDTESDGTLKKLAEFAGTLADEAEETGYGTLAAAAQALESACLDCDAKLAREATLELTEITRRVRLGHKGAA